MSGYPYGGNPQYPPPQNQIYPQLYNQPTAPPPSHLPPGQQPPMNLSYPAAQQYQQYAYPGQPSMQPGFVYQPYPGQPGQVMPPGQAMQPGQPMQAAPQAHMMPYYAAPPHPQFAAGIEWVPSSPRDAPSLSDRAVVAGYEGHDNSPLWVIRGKVQGDLLPGKLAVKHHAAYVPWDGKEHEVHNIDVLCARPECIRWVSHAGGSAIPPNAIPAGNTAAGEALYVGRAKEQGSLTPGKVHPSHKVLYISFGGQEIGHKKYEILCTV